MVDDDDLEKLKKDFGIGGEPPPQPKIKPYIPVRPLTEEEKSDINAILRDLGLEEIK